MAHPTLLNMDDPWFEWQHAMSHRDFLGVMSPLTRFSVIPYWLEPITDQRPAGPWRFNHQQAHLDAMNNLPATYLGEIVPGTAVNANLVDSNLDDAWNRSWITFQNHMEHYVGSARILPAPQTPPPPPAPIIKYPFW